MSLPAVPAGVLRGMPVARQPVAVGRIVVPEAPAAEAADRLIARVQSEAREDGWRAGHEEGLRRGHEEGLRSGLVDGQRQGEQAAEEVLAQALARIDEQQARLQRLQQSLQQVLDDALHGAEDDMVALSFAALCRIVGENALEPEVMRAQIAAVLRESCAGAGAIVRLHPQDAQLLALGGEPADATAGVRWLADPEVRLGGCILEQAHGGLDARLDTLLESCKQRLLATRAQRQRGGATP